MAQEPARVSCVHEVGTCSAPAKVMPEALWRSLALASASMNIDVDFTPPPLLSAADRGHSGATSHQAIVQMRALQRPGAWIGACFEAFVTTPRHPVAAGYPGRQRMRHRSGGARCREADDRPKGFAPQKAAEKKSASG